MAKVQFGLVVPADALDKSQRQHYMGDVHALLNAVTGAYDSAWFIDHLQFGDSDVVEGWTALTYLSALHPALYWGNIVLCQSFRNPAHLAKMAATLQMLSSGRYILGIGAGWHEEEYLAYGYDFPAAGARVDALDEALTIIKAMWTQSQTTFEGQHHRVREAWCEPKPDPVPPIMVGGTKPKMLRLTAKHADWWNVSSTSIDAYRNILQDFEHACELEKRDPGTVRRTWGGGCACAPTPEKLKAIRGERLDPGEDFIGIPQQIIDQMGPFVEMGVEYFMLDCSGFPDLTTVHTLIEDVLPVLNA